MTMFRFITHRLPAHISICLCLLLAMGSLAHAKSYQSTEDSKCERAFINAYKAKERELIETAINACSQLAKRDKAWGQYYIGRMYEAGLGFKKNTDLATTWLIRASKQNLPEAMSHLGRNMAKGVGIEVDNETAAQLFQKAAKKGDGVGQFELGLRYYDGKGLDRDYLEAYKWFTLAISSNKKEGNTSLVKLSTRKRANSARKLTKPEMRLAAAWLKKQKLSRVRTVDPGFRKKKK